MKDKRSISNMTSVLLMVHVRIIYPLFWKRWSNYLIKCIFGQIWLMNNVQTDPKLIIFHLSLRAKMWCIYYAIWLFCTFLETACPVWFLDSIQTDTVAHNWLLHSLLLFVWRTKEKKQKCVRKQTTSSRQHIDKPSKIVGLEPVTLWWDK